MIMGEMASFWAFQEVENQDMEQLGQKLLYTTLELEKLKSEAMEEMTKNKDYIRQLIHLLNLTIHERDEARSQLQKLYYNNNTILAQTLRRTNSSVTESNSLNNSSPVESLFDTVSSPEFSNVNTHVTQPLVQQEYFDHGSFVIDNMARATALPPKGKFLQAVLKAGPLLQTLLVSGPLPTWRNPPQLQSFQIPPVSMINGCDGAEGFEQKPLLNVASVNAHVQPMLNFGNNCVGNNSNVFVPLAKRQKLI